MFALVFTLVLAQFSPVTPAVGRIRPGMSAEQVEQLLGEKPAEVVATDIEIRKYAAYYRRASVWVIYGGGVYEVRSHRNESRDQRWLGK